ncbi:LacI family transcriptional regulator [Microbacterium sp. KUDC0406]|uniref:LacI family DNA-binding transcriptional regulator n=1 Tax=Microbacterium sp. KUDC0406 TaxID=2909588 RepID=UPI001F430CDB|nr:LacI family DNA-binding transcriptional regulator [Microbacterium sp. KUDC0406]UJP10362.1 LacI family transcriptional regulator [Microbacterium sp. KUDC0406]
MSTIADVAARAGVSKATASRALSGNGYVSGETRDRVRAAAAELSYVAHSSAMSLATGRSLSVGVIMPSLDRWFFAELLAGMQDSLFAEGYDLVLYGIREGSAERARLFEDILPRRRFDGILAVGIQPSAHELERLLQVSSPRSASARTARAPARSRSTTRWPHASRPSISSTSGIATSCFSAAGRMPRPTRSVTSAASTATARR